MPHFYMFLWTCYFTENEYLIWEAVEYDGFRDVFDGERGKVYPKGFLFPQQGVRTTQSAAIAHIAGRGLYQLHPMFQAKWRELYPLTLDDPDDVGEDL